jgi:hypothetical protein
LCTTGEIYRSGNAVDASDDFCIPKYDGGEHLGRGGLPYGTSGYKMSRNNTPDGKNFIRQNDDCLLYNERSTDFAGNTGIGNDGSWNGIYATSLMTDIVNFQNGSMTGHDHSIQSLTISSDGVVTRETVRINTISTGNISPVLEDNQEVLTITASIDTPSIQMLFIIKAY